jgi:cysteine desulfurase
MRTYLDNNATTPMHPAAAEALVSALKEGWGNPSSIHKEGQRARRLLEESRDAVASLIGGSPGEVVFTSGGTESNNAAIFGVTQRSAPGEIVTTAIEHPSVLQPLESLEKRGWRVTRIPPRRDGTVDPGAIAEAITPGTRLVAVMLANNETGAIQDVPAIAAAARERGVHVHCDAVQAAGRIPIDVTALGVDSLALSAHKMHGPKGIGALWLRSGTVLEPLVFGGAQERRRRGGTENAPLAAAFGAAARIARDDPRSQAVAELRDRFEHELAAGCGEIVVHAAAARRLPNTSAISFRGCDGEAIVIALDLEGFAVSTGAACSSGRLEPSHVLLAMGISMEDARSTIRISLGRFTTAAEIESAAAAIARVVSKSGRSVAADRQDVRK